MSRRRDTYFGSGEVKEFKYVNKRYCLHYDKGMCNLSGGACMVNVYCDEYDTKGRKVKAIRDEIRQASQTVRERKETEKAEKIKKMEDLDLQIGSKIKYGKYGIGEVVKINTNGNIEISFSGKIRTFKYDESVDFFEKI